jgi:YegS/Rv2252/BmrU family lipid kinase
MIVVIINPMSGPGRASPEERGRDRLARARQVLSQAGVPHRIEVTTAPGHGAALAREAVGTEASVVCAWGGDGTTNEIASVLAFTQVPLALVPNGSGNGLARELGVSLNPAHALRQALSGRDRVLDVGELGGHLFFNVAGIGFDAHVARLFNEGGRRRGFTSYITTSFTELFRYDARSYAVALGTDDVVRRRALMVVVANTAQYGNGARIAPHARPDDGLLDLVIVETSSAMGNVWRARRLFDGSMGRAPGVTIREIATAEISAIEPEAIGGASSVSSVSNASSVSTASSAASASNAASTGRSTASTGNGAGPAIWFHVDGEPMHGVSPLRVRIHPRAIRVRVPA